MTISRRAFMKAGGLALVSLGADPIFLDRAAYALQSAGPLANGKKTLVCLFQRGAVDGLSMIVPAGDPWYWQERQRIALPKEQLIPLDGMFALHPRLAPLKPLWDQHSLAIVHAVGSPSTTRSHFDAQDYMESGHAGREEHARRLGESLSARTPPSMPTRRSARWPSGRNFPARWPGARRRSPSTTCAPSACAQRRRAANRS